MTNAHCQLLPEHDVFPESAWATRYTLFAFAAACLLSAILALPSGLDSTMLLASAAVCLYRARNACENDHRGGKESPGEAGG